MRLDSEMIVVVSSDSFERAKFRLKFWLIKERERKKIHFLLSQFLQLNLLLRKSQTCWKRTFSAAASSVGFKLRHGSCSFFLHFGRIWTITRQIKIRKSRFEQFQSTKGHSIGNNFRALFFYRFWKVLAITVSNKDALRFSSTKKKYTQTSKGP